MGTVPTPLDWVANAGNLATAAMLQAGVKDCLTFLLDPPGCQVRRTTALALTAAVTALVTFDAEDSDNDTMHDLVTNTSRLTCKTAGRFLVSGMIPYDAATSGQREARLLKNSGLVAGGRVVTTTATADACVIPTIEVALAVNDFIELQALSATACNTSAANGLFPILRARWIGP